MELRRVIALNYNTSAIAIISRGIVAWSRGNGRHEKALKVVRAAGLKRR